jgi:hypothetical protein
MKCQPGDEADHARRHAVGNDGEIMNSIDRLIGELVETTPAAHGVAAFQHARDGCCCDASVYEFRQPHDALARKQPAGLLFKGT